MQWPRSDPGLCHFKRIRCFVSDDQAQSVPTERDRNAGCLSTRKVFRWNTSLSA